MNGRPSPARIEMTQTNPPVLPAGGFVDLDGEPYYRIEAFHRMAPFLMSVPSDTDLWMFLTSGGGLTAGRVDADGSLFPYVTVDRLHDAPHHTGPITVIFVNSDSGRSRRWEPFSDAGIDDPLVERSLYKNAIGNRVLFEEIHHGLGLAFRYRWAAGDELGWVRSSTLVNLGRTPLRIRVMDGLRNVLPWGAPLSLYQQSSNLVDAYKKSEVDEDTGLGIFSLTSMITDRTEALEALRANVVWSCGLEDPKICVSPSALSAFRAGRVIARELESNGVRGNYLVSTGLDLEPGMESRWHIVGDTGKDHLQVASLRRELARSSWSPERVEASLDRASDRLRRNVASADGLQLSAWTESWSHHFANVLFNNMRGGVFDHNYSIPVEDLADFLQTRNVVVANRHAEALSGLPEGPTIDEVLDHARCTGDPDFERLCYEYLPLHFSRRHGDPSRPWNQFAIRAHDQNGERELGYEGNWRDIFQNWEALGASFPRFLPGMVAKFLNASTVDGFNPYRISRDGIDWEVPIPDHPWSNIGYWGDHQIIYLLKLLEAADRHDPSFIGSLLGREVFSYADVPYRIRPYEDLVLDPRSTIDFDAQRNDAIEERTREHGTDGRLLTAADGSTYHANLLEKLLVPILSKVSNLVPDGGIWMNTQRPEWNDANNALGGGGVSVVTLCYLRRHLAFIGERLERLDEQRLPVSREVLTWFEEIVTVLGNNLSLVSGEHLAPESRKSLMDALGSAFAAYRERVYADGFSGKAELDLARVRDFCDVALRYIDWGIQSNRRADGMFHTYNQLEFSDDGRRVEIVRLPEMIEGQVAALSSGLMTPDEALELLELLFTSELYHPEQKTFLLYPRRELPGFLEKNAIPGSAVEATGLLSALVAGGDQSIVARDADGVFRFNAGLRSGDHLDKALSALASCAEWKAAIQRDRGTVLDLFEDVFGHKSYTGRSGVMYGYEGLGCVYWHMVAKLLLATQENFLRADAEGAPEAVRNGLATMYFRIRSGIGYEKSVAEYGAFPPDPYSHTPAAGGARQPGMTGQVKEEILTRLGELGVQIEAGTVSFRPRLVRRDEPLESPGSFQYFDVAGEARSVEVPSGGLAFTFCQVPVVYQVESGESWIEVALSSGDSGRRTGNKLDAETSADLFSRSGRIREIRVGVPWPEFARA